MTQLCLPGMGWCRIGFAALLAGWMLAAPVLAQTLAPAVEPWQEAGTQVDVALVLAVDISYSMDIEEQRLQREGYIAALTSKPVLDAIRKGMIGKIAVTYLEWAGTTTRNMVADWHIIEDENSTEAFVSLLRDAPIRRARRTSLTSAIDFSMERLRAANLHPLRRVIDISGDGPNNEGGPVTRARNRALEAGVTINGLPIVIHRGGAMSSFDIENLDTYYQDCVIGGPGAFMIVVRERAQFADAIRAKIIREVAQASQSDITAPPQTRTDCQIGEKLWRNNWERN